MPSKQARGPCKTRTPSGKSQPVGHCSSFLVFMPLSEKGLGSSDTSVGDSQGSSVFIPKKAVPRKGKEHVTAPRYQPELQHFKKKQVEASRRSFRTVIQTSKCGRGEEGATEKKVGPQALGLGPVSPISGATINLPRTPQEHIPTQTPFSDLSGRVRVQGECLAGPE